MRESPFPGVRACSLALLAIAILTPPGFGAVVQPDPLLLAEEDLYRAVPRLDGSVVVLGTGGLDLLRPGTGPVRLAQTDSNQTLVLSEDGLYYGLVRHREGAADFAPAERFELRTMNGVALWQIGPTEDVTFAIAPGGGSVVGMSLNINLAEQNRLHFYGAEGRSLGAAAVPYLTSGCFDPEGRIFLALSTEDGLIAYDPSGKELWRAPGARLFAAAPSGEMVAVIGPAGLSVLRSGRVIAQQSLVDPLSRRLAVSADGSRIAVAWKHTIQVYDGALTPLYAVQTETETVSWTSLDLGGNGGLLLAGCALDAGPGAPEDRRHPTGEIRVFDRSGALLHRVPLSFSSWNIWSPSARVTPGGHALLITSRRALYQAVMP